MYIYIHKLHRVNQYKPKYQYIYIYIDIYIYISREREKERERERGEEREKISYPHYKHVRWNLINEVLKVSDEIFTVQRFLSATSHSTYGCLCLWVYLCTSCVCLCVSVCLCGGFPMQVDHTHASIIWLLICTDLLTFQILLFYALYLCNIKRYIKEIGITQVVRSTNNCKE